MLPYALKSELDPLLSIDHELKQLMAQMTVMKYQMEQQQQAVVNTAVHERITEVANEIGEITPTNTVKALANL